MASRRSPSFATTIALLAIFLALGLLLRAWNLGGESLWLDEAHSINQAKRWWGTIWGPAAVAEPNPPLYFTILQVWIRVFGDSEVAARSLSVLFGTVTILAVFILGRLAGGTSLGLGAAALGATSPMLVIYSRETRGYALVILAAVISLAGALSCLSRLSRSCGGAGLADRHSLAAGMLSWGAYIIGAIVSVYTHNTLVLLPVIASIAALIVWVTAPRLDWRFAAQWCLANAAILAAYLPWIPMVLGGDVATGNFWIAAVSMDAALDTVRFVYGQSYLADLQPWFDIALAVLALAGLAALARGSRAAFILFLSVIVLVPLGTYLASLYSPIFIPRVLLWPVPLVAIVCAAGALTTPRMVIATALIGTIIAGQVVALTDPRATIKFEPWRDIVRTIAAARQPGDAIVIAPAYAAMPFEYYAGPDPDVLTVAMLEPARKSSRWSYDVIGPDDVSARVAGRHRVWLVIRSEPADMGMARLTAGLDGVFRLVSNRVMGDVTVYLFSRRP